MYIREEGRGFHASYPRPCGLCRLSETAWERERERGHRNQREKNGFGGNVRQWRFLRDETVNLKEVGPGGIHCCLGPGIL